MSPSKRYATKQAKARQRRRLQAHERLERDRRQAQRAAEALHQALKDVGGQQTWWANSQAAYTAHKSFLASSSG